VVASHLEVVEPRPGVEGPSRSICVEQGGRLVVASHLEAVALTVGIRYALAAVYEEHRDVIAVLWSLGMSERRLWLEMAARIAAAAVAASLAGYLAGYALLSVVYDLAVLRLLIHLSIPPPEPITPAAVAAYSAATAFMIRPKVGGGG